MKGEVVMLAELLKGVVWPGDTVLLIGRENSPAATALEDLVGPAGSVQSIAGSRDTGSVEHGPIHLDDLPVSPADLLLWDSSVRFDLTGALVTITKFRPAIVIVGADDQQSKGLEALADGINYRTRALSAGLDGGNPTMLLAYPREKRGRFHLAGGGMAGAETPSTQGRADTGEREASPAVEALCIAVSFYRAPHLPSFIAEGLTRLALELRSLNCKVLLFNDSPDDPELATALKEAQARVAAHIDCILETNERNLGFVQTMNIAMRKARQAGNHLLLLNSDAMPGPGALTEMMAVMRSDPMIGFVCPRSNNATIATAGQAEVVPGTTIKDHEELERRICASLRFLPRVQYVPTGVGFCLLIKDMILQEFGDFSTEYGKGYNEENDYIMRAGRCGFRAALANWAYAVHIGEQSFVHDTIGRDARDKENRKLLSARYPEYDGNIESYFASDDFLSERFLTTLRQRRLSLAIDGTALYPWHNGTISLLINMIRCIARQYGSALDLVVIGRIDAIKFHHLDEIAGVRFESPWPRDSYDVVLRIGQPFGVSGVDSISRLAPVNVFFMLDTIAMDCGQLYSETIERTWRFVCSTADGLIYNSRFTRDQFRRRFRLDPATAELVSHHSVDLAEYRHANVDQIPMSGFVLIIGNGFPHKNVLPTYMALVAALPENRYAVISESSDKPAGARGDDVFYEAGGLSEGLIAALYAHASAVVFPSYYEGFGLPIQHALAYQRPVLVRDNAVNHEIMSLSHTKNVHMYASNRELVERLAANPKWIAEEPVHDTSPHDWNASAREVVNFCLQCLNRTDIAIVTRRRRELNMLVMQEEFACLRRARRVKTGFSRFFSVLKSYFAILSAMRSSMQSDE